MADYKYKALKDKPKTLLAMTGLTVAEFEKMALCFQIAWDSSLLVAGRLINERRGCPGKLDLVEDKLLFVLFYLKTYPLQEVLGYSFGLSQGVANQWIHRLCPVLQSTLEAMGHAPTRLPEELLSRLNHELDQTIGIDGTERRIQRSLDPEIQRDHYSGKKKAHTVKNNLIVGLEDRDIKYLGETYPGKVHDKRMADKDGAQLPEGYAVFRDLGFQGHDIGKNVQVFEPKKKPRGGELRPLEKANNQFISSIRVVVEHVIGGVKRCHCVKSVFRNWREDFDDVVIELACGLHNFRMAQRIKNY